MKNRHRTPIHPSLGQLAGHSGQLEAKVIPTMRGGSARLGLSTAVWPVWRSIWWWLQLIGNYTFWLVQNGNEVETKLCRAEATKVHGILAALNLLAAHKFIKNRWPSAGRAMLPINKELQLTRLKYTCTKWKKLKKNIFLIFGIIYICLSECWY